MNKFNYAILVVVTIIFGIAYSIAGTPVFTIFVSGLAIIPASIAKNKGYKFGKWWCYGFILFIIALIHAFFLPTLKKADIAEIATQNSLDGSMKKCPYCAELIQVEAKLCRYCHSNLTKVTDENQQLLDQSQDTANIGAFVGLAENIVNVIAFAEINESLSLAMDPVDGASSALEAAESVVEMVEAIDVVSSTAEAMSAVGEVAAGAADVWTSLFDFFDLFSE